ncbi:NAD(P)H-dependent oxidoreductase subunit E [Thauera aromatica]|uniref:NADH-ubiquinone oxidoreductase-F iron-sulfur binding region domain-containing protein n=1 Tax=Thauera aromatica TaxID=59405 RepID=UPI001FFCAC62|nr:NADH-ubiquinone oxidoreductase-F iron-sulfur binding region domain-containing protein [Thauera aromatica]MCK2087844.1 NAD(P)H-dependent oxidoreductase subunit E [Thauera aromatica]
MSARSVMRGPTRQPLSETARDAARAALAGEAPRRDRLIEYLHRLQDAHGALHAGHLAALAEALQLARAEVFEVATFYHHFDFVAEGGAAPPALTVRVCDSLGCAMAGGAELAATLATRLGAGVRVQRVPCVGRCDSAPVAVVGQRPVLHADVDTVAAVVASGEREEALPAAIRFDAYRAAGGYALWEAVCSGARDPASIVAALDAAGLRGLGGAGFPAARKWRTVAAQPAPRHMAVNIDEGEPGTFKDRHYLSTDPHRFIEGMLIAARVVGIAAIWIYIRDEYPALRRLLAEELERVRVEWPELPPIELRRGAGAYVCGEESAMIESIEGKRGMPRLRPPYVAEVGLFGRPTLEHNLETLWWVRDIVEMSAERGADGFARHGRHGRKGLRSFSVSGRVARPGVVVTDAGITLRELIDEHCGGMLPGHELYGYFPGGASGGILPARLADVPLDFDTLAPHGCFIGSAAIVVFSQHDQARLLAENAMAFFAHESCGQCTPCRVGTAKAVELMQAPAWDAGLLTELGRTMMDASICGLGQAAPNPMQSVLRFFPHEVGGARAGAAADALPTAPDACPAPSAQRADDTRSA